MSDPDNAPQLVDPRTEHPAYVVWRWLRMTIAVVANVVVLALFAAYFDDQTLGLLDIISIVADAMGIILGLLGIWFFFLSERLNRTTALNLERTTASVDVLHDQMWSMIQKTFNKFVAQESEEKAEAAREQIQELKEQVKSSDSVDTDKFIQAIEALSKRIDTMERQRESMAPALFNESNVSRMKQRHYGLSAIADNIDKFPMSIGIFIEMLATQMHSPSEALKATIWLLDEKFLMFTDGLYKPGESYPMNRKVEPGVAALNALSPSLVDRYVSKRRSSDPAKN
jgi:hypothetical protein